MEPSQAIKAPSCRGLALITEKEARQLGQRRGEPVPASVRPFSLPPPVLTAGLLGSVTEAPAVSDTGLPACPASWACQGLGSGAPPLAQAPAPSISRNEGCKVGVNTLHREKVSSQKRQSLLFLTCNVSRLISEKKTNTPTVKWAKRTNTATRVTASIACSHPEVNGSTAWLEDTAGDGPTGLSPGLMVYWPHDLRHVRLAEP